MAPRRKNKFNIDWSNEYGCIGQVRDDDTLAQCKLCNKTISIANGGKSDIAKHINGQSHKSHVLSAAASTKVTKFFGSAKMGQVEQKIALSEAIHSFHVVNHNQSFRSMDCMTDIIQTLYEPKFSCRRTKTAAIIKNVLGDYAAKLLKDDLSKAAFITIMTDSSNHKATKLFPVLVRYFDWNVGVGCKLLDLETLDGETSDMISEFLLNTVGKHSIKNKIIAFAADNTNTNFGGKNRTSSNNVYRKLEKDLGNIIGVGCYAHILNNAIQTGSDNLPVDIDIVVQKIYQYFYIFTVRTAKLKSFCDFVGIEYKPIMGFSKTRWLSLFPAMSRFIEMYVPLKSYFLSITNCPKIILNFFTMEDGTGEVFLHFLVSFSKLFHDNIKRIEGEEVTLLETELIVEEMINALDMRFNNKFVPNCVNKLMEDFPKANIDKVVKTILHTYEITSNYLKQWKSNIDVAHLKWALLNKKIEWQDFSPLLRDPLFAKVITNLDDTELFDEVMAINVFLKDQIAEWAGCKLSISAKWLLVNKHMADNGILIKNIKKIIEFLFTLPGTNACCERVFSLINNYWGDDKSQLTTTVLKSVVTLKFNINKTCKGFYNEIKENVNLLNEVHTSGKYDN